LLAAMRGRFTLPAGAGALLGALAGALVGLCDGARAAWVFGVQGRAAAAAVALSIAVDALAGLTSGAVVEVVTRLAVWGRRAAAPLGARMFAFLVAGGFAAYAMVAVVEATAVRNNRFLAAGLAALAAVSIASLGALLASALARAVGRRVPGKAAVAPGPALLLIAPAVGAVLGGAVFLVLWPTRSPLRGAAFVEAASRAAVPALFLPWALARAAAIHLRIRWLWALLTAAVAYGAVVAWAIERNWSDNLRFAPWVDITVGGAIVVVGLGLVALVGPRLPRARARVAASALGAFVLAGALLLAVSASEAARKAAGARAGLVASALELGRQASDLDGDGYAGLFGGGDCDDGDPATHPEALDLPGDGVDSDCDGQDAAAGVPAPAVMAEVPPGVPRDLNLLFLTIDTLRADHLGCYGYPRPTSPEIDRLAAEGTLFENGWAHAPSTRYSMPALATGRWPSAIEWDESIWWPRIGAGTRTLAQALHDDRFFTGGLFSFNYFAPADRRGFERGMDVYSADRGALHVAVNGPMESRGSSSRQMADDALAFVDAHRDQRFFLWLHFYDPHLSYEPHPEVPSFGPARVDLYDGEIRFTDLHVGRVLTRLKELGLWNRTAVVLTGDHGEGFGEHGVTEHGFDLYAPQTKVPFIVRVPGLPARRSRLPVGHIDIAPTLVNLARGKPEPSFFGRSLVPELDRGRSPDELTRWVFQEVTSERGKKRALVTATRHLIWNWVPDNTTECYDRVRDPAEAHDLWGRSGAAGDADGGCAALKVELQRLVAALALPPGVAEKMARSVTAPGAPAPKPSRPLQAMIGDDVEVLGTDLAPSVVAPGGEVTVTYYFSSKKRVAKPWRLFFHLEGPGGYRNLDHVPVEGLMPIERWRPGQRIRDTQRIGLPVGSPRGNYTVYVGGFRGPLRLPVTPKALTDGADRLRVGTFVVR
jgi:choline-sulfatase